MRKTALFGYFWGLLVVDADLGIRLTSDSLSGSEGYCGSSEAKDYVANSIANNFVGCFSLDLQFRRQSYGSQNLYGNPHISR